MRFLVDVHHIGGRATGNETWARETALAMARRLDPDSDEMSLAASTDVAEIFGPGAAVDRIGTGAWQRLGRDLPRIAKARDVDAVLVQYTAPLTSRPVVVAIHDLSFTSARSRDWIPAPERARMNATIRWSARRAATVVALSQHTAQDLQEQWGISPDRIVVAYPAVAPDFVSRLDRLRAEPPQERADELRVLIVGNVLPRKNHVVVAEAVRRLRDKGLPVSLRIAGQVPPAGQAMADQLEALGSSWTTVTGYLDDDALVREYLAADVLCYPSLYEGFGIPVLEAMAARLPVVVSDATALPEAAGDAGTIVPADDAGAWADALERVLTDPTAAASMRDRGVEHERLFRWDRTADDLLDALRRAAG